MSNISDSASEYLEEEIQTDVPVDKPVAPIIVTNRPHRQTKPSAKIHENQQNWQEKDSDFFASKPMFVLIVSNILFHKEIKIELSVSMVTVHKSATLFNRY